ncbi:MAG: ferrous iron transport protein A [Candidatus Altiarchaeales archaeon ex4484_43]|nr:MAG: ferrous iron transport protein A [Candidatus Altiarchaeales archaeon ex4484_43]RLI89199.1 MAG: ferrous iron transport protein A [Candidatus Altiarchaeales archaeon]
MSNRAEKMKKILNQMRYGEKGRIVEIKTTGLRAKLMGMNIRIGKEVKMLAKQPLKGPVAIEVENAQTSLSQEMAKQIVVEV